MNLLELEKMLGRGGAVLEAIVSVIFFILYLSIYIRDNRKGWFAIYVATGCLISALDIALVFFLIYMREYHSHLHLTKTFYYALMLSSSCMSTIAAILGNLGAIYAAIFILKNLPDATAKTIK